MEELTPEDISQLTKAYKDVEQYIPDNRPIEGRVEIELMTKEAYREETMKRISDKIVELHVENNIPYKKIAILVRYNRTIREIALHFMENSPEIRMVSDEAFQLDASLSVNIIIYALRVIAHPEDVLSKANLVKAYQKQIRHNQISDKDLFVNEEGIDGYLPSKFIDSMDTLANFPIPDLVEQLFRIFELDQLNEQSSYMCAFYDQLNKFLLENVADIDAFLREWDENLYKKSIHSDEIDGIRLITIHKSKGLEFDHVIMPFCDWRLEKTSLLWCIPPNDISPFNKLPLIPIDFNKKDMKETVFWNHYQQEHFQNVVDNLNLLYVAFTRAKKSLFVYGKREDKNTRSYLIEQCLPSLEKTLKNSVIEGANEDKNTNITFSYGELSTNNHQDENTKTDNVFNQQVFPQQIQINSYDGKVKFYQSNKSKTFVTQDPETEKQNGYILLGNILHNIFSTIGTKDDIEPALQALEQEGVLYNENITKVKLKEMLANRLNDKKVEEWFSDKWTILNECTILTYDEINGKTKEYRPDRVLTDGNEVVVIDFKFGIPDSEHHKQVLKYMSLLADMGYAKIKGYLWYVYSNLIKEVK